MHKSRSLRDAFKFMSGNMVVFSVTGLLGNFARSMVFPYASLYILSLGGNAQTIGLVNFLRPLAGLIIFPIAGYLTDRAGRVKLIVLGNWLSVVFVLMYLLAPSWEVVAAAALLQGLGVLGFPPRSALIADSLAPGARGRGIATMNTISSGLSLFAPYIAGVVVDVYGPNTGVRALYGAMMTLYLASVVIHLRFLTETMPGARAGISAASLPGVVRDAYGGIPDLLRRLPASLKALTGVIVLSFMSNGVASPFWVVYALEEIGLSSSRWGFILLCETALRTAMSIPSGILVDRWGRTASLLTALLLSLAAIPLFVFVKGFAVVLMIRVVIGLASAIAIPAATALMADTVPREIRGRVMAMLGQGGVMIGSARGGMGGPGMGLLITLPLMAASLLGGWLYAQNPAYPWFFVLSATIVSIILALVFIRDPKKAQI